MDSAVQKAFELAKKILNNAHAPYSNLQVAAVLKVKGQDLYVPGVNVENASYGGTICAERSAVVSTQSHHGPFEMDFIVVISTFDKGTIPPCGICLQVLAEFAEASLPVHLGNSLTITETTSLGELLPKSFTNKDLP